MAAEPLLNAHDIAHELFDFIATFLALGAVGFRWVVLTGVRHQTGVVAADEPVFARMFRPAAFVGLAGAAILVFHSTNQALYLQGALREMTAATPEHARTARAFTQAAVVAWAFGGAALGFALAAFDMRAAWALAGAGMMVGVLRAAVFGQWSRLIKPTHLFAAGLWIGTLLVLVAVGIAVAMRAAPAGRRGPIVAGLVNAFSPFALTLGAAVATFGGILALRELPSVAALWTTPYGTALSIKLALVAGVFALGARNAFRLRPRLGAVEAVPAIRRSAFLELLVALLVITVTAILVTLPSPKAP
jgi:putative copper export protein